MSNLKNKLGISIDSKDSVCVLKTCSLPKMHKTLIKGRFITKASKYLSKAVPLTFQSFSKQIEAYGGVFTTMSNI